MIYIKRFNWCLVGIPKCGSEATRYWFYDNVFQPGDLISLGDNPITEEPMITSEPVPEQLLINPHITVQNQIDNNLTPLDCHYVGIIRDPLERMLSLYCYRLTKPDRNDVNWEFRIPDPKEFKRLVKEHNGRVPDPYKHQVLPLYRFMQYNGEYVPNHEWWLMDNLPKHIKDFCSRYNIEEKTPFIRRNTLSSKEPLLSSKHLMDLFYDEETRKIASEYHWKDIELYESVKARFR